MDPIQMLDTVLAKQRKAEAAQGQIDQRASEFLDALFTSLQQVQATDKLLFLCGHTFWSQKPILKTFKLSRALFADDILIKWGRFSYLHVYIVNRQCFVDHHSSSTRFSSRTYNSVSDTLQAILDVLVLGRFDVPPPPPKKS